MSETDRERGLRDRIRILEQDYKRKSETAGTESSDPTWYAYSGGWSGTFPPGTNLGSQTLVVSSYSADPGTPVDILFTGASPYISIDDAFTSCWYGLVTLWEPYPLISGFRFDQTTFPYGSVISSAVIYFNIYIDDAGTTTYYDVYIWDGTQWNGPVTFILSYGVSWHVYSVNITPYLNTPTKVNQAKLKVVLHKPYGSQPYVYTTYCYIVVQGTIPL